MKLHSSENLLAVTYRRFWPATFLVALIGIVSSPVPLWAEWFVNVCPGGQKYAGLPARQGPFETQSKAQSFADEENRTNGGCFTVSGSDGAASSSTGSDASSGLSPLNQSAYSLGEALGNQIRADDAAAKAKADELERERVEKERQEAEERRLKYEASKTELLNNLKDSASDSGEGLREVGSSGDNSGLREVGSGESFMQGPAPKRSKVKHVAHYKYLATPTPAPARKPAPKPKPDPTPQEEVAGVQHADMLKDGVQLTGKPENELKDQIWVENTNENPVDVHVWMAGESKNSAHSLRNNIHLEPGESVQVGWAANTTNEDPWNYQLGMNVTQK